MNECEKCEQTKNVNADWEFNDTQCQNCGHCPTRTRKCDAVGCEDGMFDEFEGDQLFSQPGDYRYCEECNGKGRLHWCPKCGEDVEENKGENL